MLIPVCMGIGIMAYFDTKKSASSKDSETTPIGAIFALAGVMSSGIYTVWVSRYHKKLDISSIQLLHQQSLFGGVLLLFCIPFFDKLPHYSVISARRWMDILLVSRHVIPHGLCRVLTHIPERWLRHIDQRLAIQHHHWCRTSIEHCRRPRQDSMHRVIRLDDEHQTCQWQ